MIFGKLKPPSVVIHRARETIAAAIGCKSCQEKAQGSRISAERKARLQALARARKLGQ